MQPLARELLSFSILRTSFGWSGSISESVENSIVVRTGKGEHGRITGWSVIITGRADRITGSFGAFTGLAAAITRSSQVSTAPRHGFTGDVGAITRLFSFGRRGPAAPTIEDHASTIPAASFSGDAAYFTNDPITFTRSILHFSPLNPTQP